MIDHIDIKEIEIGDDERVILAIAIHLKLDGYAPKYSLEYLKNINTGAEKKTTPSFFDEGLPNGGGVGGIRTHVPQGAS